MLNMPNKLILFIMFIIILFDYNSDDSFQYEFK